MDLADLGLIGNCQFSALVARTGEIVWCCLPRFDSEPIFGSLLDPDGGGFLVGPADGSVGTSRYLENTNVLETRFEGPDGAFRVIDFAPRFEQHGRSFRPTQIVRIVEPLSGTPMIRVVAAPRLGWSKEVAPTTHGSNHVRYEGFPTQVRLTTDVPLSYLDGRPVALTSRKHLVLTWGSPIEEALAPLCARFLAETTGYWRRWVKHCDVPAHYQDEVIRSALALKLHCFEDTGAIVAATTTSLPEAPGAGRNWDYRYCWLRDSGYVLGALRLLGQFEEREAFVHYLFNVAARSPTLDLAPLYRVDGGSDLDESVLTEWAGYEGHGPVRIGNGAAVHVQNDVFGEVVLALAPIFLDDRFSGDRTPEALDLLARLTDKALSTVGQPDAGIWEIRSQWQPQTFSSLFAWAAADRMATVAARHVPTKAGHYRAAAERVRAQIVSEAWSPKLGAFASTWGGHDLDASLLQMAPLRFLPANDPRLIATVDQIRSGLDHAGWLYRYRTDDGLGKTEVAFVICTYWMIEALACIGRVDDARRLLDQARKALSPLGLMSEDVDPPTGRLWGNFPQAYSHVGMIHAAFAASPSWSQVL